MHNAIEQKIDKIHAKCDRDGWDGLVSAFSVIMNFLRNNEF